MFHTVPEGRIPGRSRLDLTRASVSSTDGRSNQTSRLFVLGPGFIIGQVGNPSTSGLALTTGQIGIQARTARSDYNQKQAQLAREWVVHLC